MKKITLILGGARSGKSSYALELARKYKKVAFIATCQALDKEMAKRIKLHKESRPKDWDTFEEPKEVEAILKKLTNKYECIVIDCLTLLVSNLFLSGLNKKTIEDKISKLVAVLKRVNCRVIMVSNEVGLGIVPDNKMARDFRDVAGRVNQIIAAEADEVFFMAAGLSIKIK
jgi:adenosylcobinamide kinase/adenosylcobinamide-phosphate guanylyltransferase